MKSSFVFICYIFYHVCGIYFKKTTLLLVFLCMSGCVFILILNFWLLFFSFLLLFYESYTGTVVVKYLLKRRYEVITCTASAISAVNPFPGRCYINTDAQDVFIKYSYMTF